MEETFAARHKIGDYVTLDGDKWRIVSPPFGSGARNARGELVEEQVTLTLERSGVDYAV